jgi:drug/metabolite transporter (DMT)-like permease
VKTEDIDARDAASPGSVRRSSLLLALAGFSIFSLGDGITKSTAGLWPGTAVGTLRFFIGACGLALLLLITEGRRAFVVPQPLIQLGRAAAMTFSTICFFTAVQIIPLATATAVAFTTPLLTAMISALLLRERIPLRTWAAIILAFAGVMLVLRPNFSSAGPFALLPLFSALGMACLMILNRATVGHGSPLASQMLVAALATPMLAAVSLVMHLSGGPAFHIGMPSWLLIARVAVLSVGATIGHWLIYAATIRASAATIAPANYVQILFAVAIGWMCFGDMPDALTFAGIALIIGAGAWLMRVPEVRR